MSEIEPWMIECRDERIAELTAELQAAEEQNAKLALCYATPCDQQFDSWIAESMHFRSRAEAAERWQHDVADGLGYCNHAEGQSGYEVAEPSAIIMDFRYLESRAEAAEAERDALLRPGEWVESQLNDGGGVTLAMQIIDKQNADIDRLHAEVARLTKLTKPTSANYWHDKYQESRTRIAALEAGLKAAWDAMCERRSYSEAWEWKYKPTWDEEDEIVSELLNNKINNQGGSNA